MKADRKQAARTASCVPSEYLLLHMTDSVPASVGIIEKIITRNILLARPSSNKSWAPPVYLSTKFIIIVAKVARTPGMNYDPTKGRGLPYYIQVPEPKH